LKSLELIIDHLKVGKLERNFDLGPPNDAKTNVDKFFAQIL
jgi:hypothetical protein